MRPATLALGALLTLPSLASATDPVVSHCHLPRWTSPEPDLGQYVEIEGDTAVVGNSAGSLVRVYRRTGTTWTATQTLVGAVESGFGVALALNGEYLAIGAPFDDTVGANAGAVHIYRLIGNNWSYETTLYDDTPSVNGFYGISVDLDGHFLAAGASGDAGGGSAHVYLRTFSDWLPAATIGALGTDALGTSIALGAGPGDFHTHLFVGDSSDDVAGVNAGAVHAFSVVPGFATPGPVLRPLELDASDLFGGDVAFDDGVLVVGAFGDDDQGSVSGAAYVYNVPDAAGVVPLTLKQKLVPADGTAGDEFGRSVDVDDGRVLVGARLFDGGGAATGKAFVFQANALTGTWFTVDTLAAGDGSASDNFGWDVAISGQAVLAGAPGVDAGGGKSGAAYLFSLSPGSGMSGECPCPVLGSQAYYGEGKPGSLGMPYLSASTHPIPGSKHLLGLKNVLTGVAPVLAFGLVPGEIPFDDGALLVADLHLVNMPVVGVLNQVGIGWDVPSDPLLCGVSLYTQALFFDPAATGSLKTAQTAGLELTIGY